MRGLDHIGARDPRPPSDGAIVYQEWAARVSNPTSSAQPE
jgi:hypothetical protein